LTLALLDIANPVRLSRSHLGHRLGESHDRWHLQLALAGAHVEQYVGAARSVAPGGGDCASTVDLGALDESLLTPLGL
jgi:hypothetical protein